MSGYVEADVITTSEAKAAVETVVETDDFAERITLTGAEVKYHLIRLII